MFGISMVSSAIFTYLWLLKLFNKVPSFFGALFYLYVPYRLFDLYKRGSMGEILALTVIPFILWQVERKSFLLSTLGIAILILSHNTLAALFLPVIISYLLLDIFIAKKKKELALRYITILILGFCLSAFFSIPSISELNNTVFSRTIVSDFQKYFADYNLIGIPTLLIFCVAMGMFIIGKANVSRHRLTILFLFLGVLSIVLSMQISSSLWQILPVSFVQFPFRFLSVAILCASFLFAFILSVISEKKAIIVGILVVLATFLLSKPYLTPGSFSNFPDSFYSTNEATTTVHDEYMPKWVEEKPVKHPVNKVEVTSGKTTVQTLSYNSKNISFIASSTSPSVVRINTIYYPGWTAQLNNKNINIDYSNKFGVMDVTTPIGANKVQLKFEETSPRLIADTISIMALILLVTLPFIRIKNKPLI